MLVSETERSYVPARPCALAFSIAFERSVRFTGVPAYVTITGLSSPGYRGSGTSCAPTATDDTWYFGAGRSAYLGDTLRLLPVGALLVGSYSGITSPLRPTQFAYGSADESQRSTSSLVDPVGPIL